MSWPLTRSDCCLIGLVVGSTIAFNWDDAPRGTARLLGFAVGTLIWFALRYGVPALWRRIAPRLWHGVAGYALRRVVELQEAEGLDAAEGALSPVERIRLVRPATNTEVSR